MSYLLTLSLATHVLYVQQQWWEMVHQQQLVEPLMKMVSTSFTIATVISLMMCCTVPAGPPRQVFFIAETSTSLNITWSAPTTPNGVITEYQLQCSSDNTIFTWAVMGSQTTTTLSGLLPYISYSCSITAHTSAGGGPAATTSVTTLQDGESTSIDNPLLMSFSQFLVDHLRTSLSQSLLVASLSPGLLLSSYNVMESSLAII